MITRKILLLLLIVSLPAMAAQTPSMATLWIELALLAIVLLVLKLAKISNQQKLMTFLVYVLSGIISKTIWLPVLLFVIIFFIFNQNNDDN